MRIKLYLIPSSVVSYIDFKSFFYQIESNDISYGLFVLYDQYFYNPFISPIPCYGRYLGDSGTPWYFEVKMWPCAPARITYIDDVLVLVDPISF